jgi:Zn-dependent protease
MGLLGKKWRIMTIAGFPIEVNLTFLILLGLVFLVRGGLLGIVLTLLVFTSILVHELGHAIVARKLGVRIAGIELQFFGGMAKMVTPPRSARDEILIAVAGPAVSLSLAMIGITLGVVTGSPWVNYFGVTNLILGVFNLLPALPMDGGRIYRAYRAQRIGVLAATEKAVTLSKYIAIGLGVLGILGGQFFVAAIAVMIYLMSRAELAMAWQLHYNDVPAERIDYDILDPTGRVIHGPAHRAGVDLDEERFNGVHRVTFRYRR